MHGPTTQIVIQSRSSIVYTFNFEKKNVSVHSEKKTACVFKVFRDMKLGTRQGEHPISWCQKLKAIHVVSLNPC